MSLLIKRYSLGTCWRCVSAANTARTQKFGLPLLLNLERQFRFVYGRLFSAETSLSASNANVKKYFDYLTNVYANQNNIDNLEDEVFNSQLAVSLLNKRIGIKEDILNLKDIDISDSEMKKLKEEEELIYARQLEKIDNELLDTLLQNLGKTNYSNVVMEITAGVGGQEAMLFVKDLCNMYIGYAKYLGLDYEIIEMDDCSQGGFRHVSFIVNGENAFDKLRYEGGVHRVQRIPATERSGRIHTSTASVAILPEPTDIEVNLQSKDYKIETKKASGAGGQHVNTTDSAVRLTHLSTGIIINCQTDRSQIKNRELALLKLKTILYERQLSSQATASKELRKKQIGMGMRNEKIRTYNYNQDRITDHRIPNATMHHLKDFMDGGAQLEELENRLHKDMQKKILTELINKSESQLK